MAHEPNSSLAQLFPQPVYKTLCNYLLRPDRTVYLTEYFFWKWLPRLGPMRWLLVLHLRQVCEEEAGDRKRGRVTRADLAHLLDTHPRTLSRILKHRPHPTDKGWRVLDVTDDEGNIDQRTYYLSQFIPRLRYWYKKEVDSPPKRQGFILEVMIDDPLTEEDEAQLGKLQIDEIRAILGAQASSIPTGQNVASGVSPTRQNVTSQTGHTGQDIPSGTPGPLQHPVRGAEARSLRRQNVASQKTKLDITTPTGLGVSVTLTLNELTSYIENLDRNIASRRSLREALTPAVQMVEHLLDDYHSTRMFYKVLTALYPDQIQLFLQAVAEALAVGEYDAGANLGAVFVTSVKGLAVEAGADLGLSAREESLAPAASIIGQSPLAPEVSPTHSEANKGSVSEMGADRELWDTVLGELRLQMTKATFDTWLRSTCLLREEEGQVVVGVPNGYVKEWLEHRLQATIRRTLTSLLGKPLQVAFQIVGEADDGGDQLHQSEGRL